MATEQIQGVYDQIITLLTAEKNRVREEISNYPPPIPACDVQFNYLLEKRTRITQALARIRAIAAEDLPPSDALPLVAEFLEASNYLDEEAAQRVRAALVPSQSEPLA